MSSKERITHSTTKFCSLLRTVGSTSVWQLVRTFLKPKFNFCRKIKETCRKFFSRSFYLCSKLDAWEVLPWTCTRMQQLFVRFLELKSLGWNKHSLPENPHCQAWLFGKLLQNNLLMQICSALERNLQLKSRNLHSKLTRHPRKRVCLKLIYFLLRMMNCDSSQSEKNFIVFVLFFAEAKEETGNIMKFIALLICISTKDVLNKGNLFN